jgi:hypothetical protein
VNLARLCPTSSLLLIAASILPLGCTHRPPTQQATSKTPPPLTAEITIDDHCAILSSDRDNPTHTDNAICHLESVHVTQHTEEKIREGVTQTALVEVRERDYVLQNPYAYPVAFVVKQPIPTGFRIDSDPQPIATANSIATFHVLAEPGQIVRLHVGERN